MRHFICATLTVLATSIQYRASAQCLRYTADIIDLPPCVPFGYQSLAATGVSENGYVCGATNGCGDSGELFAWFGQSPLVTLTSFPNGWYGLSTNGINSSGYVIGSMNQGDAAPLDRAFLYHDGIIQNLGVLPEHTLFPQSEAQAINDQGQICGYSQQIDQQAVVWQNGVIGAINLPLGPNSVANDISDSGLVCGWMGEYISPEGQSHAFIYDLTTGQTIDLGVPLVGSIAGEATGINNLGAVCGWSYSDCVDAICTGRRGYLWSNGSVKEIGSLPGFPQCIPQALNDSDVVVGYCSTVTGDTRAFVWQNGVIHALNDLIATPNVGIHIAWSINNAGQIAGEGYNLIPVIHLVAIRLTPIPPVAGDITCDWRVDHLDLLQVIFAWGECPAPVPPLDSQCPADFNHDGRVNVQDLLFVINHWSAN